MYAFDFIKFNSNCPKEEKQGEGPGSCGGSKKDSISKASNAKRSKVPVTIKPNDIKFTPAKTSADAEKFAYDNLLDITRKQWAEDWNSGKIAKLRPDQVQQMKLINYRGIDVKVANIINESILRNNKMGLPSPTKIIATQMKKKPNTLMSIGTSGDLLVNTIAVGNFKKIDASLAVGKQLREKFASESHIIEANIEKLDKLQQATYKNIKEALKYSRDCVGYELDSTPERALTATINHEVAHNLSKRGKYGYDTPQHDEFMKEYRQVAKTTINSDYKYKLSSYGCQEKQGIFIRPVDLEETFAEMYAAWRFKEDDNLHPDAIKFFKKYLPER